AHQRGLLHRDLKSGNILLDAQGEPHVTDFGIAKVTETENSLTASGEILGTPGYMAPEQAAGKTKDIGVTADIYSLGAVLYALLTGSPTFIAPNRHVLLWKVLEEEAAPPSRINPRVDRDLETICLKCLEKEPGRRYASSQALAEDLERWLDGRPL